MRLVGSEAMEPQVLAAIIAAVTALVAVIVGPIVTINLGKRSMLAPMRQKTWENRYSVSENIVKLFSRKNGMW